MKHENAIQCLQVMKGAECINALSQEFPEHYGIENIEALELAIEVLKKNRWIPCSERLPEPWIRVLVSRKHEPGITDMPYALDVCTAFYVGEGKWRIDPPKQLKTVSYVIEAWMPWPEPYKEGDQE